MADPLILTPLTPAASLNRVVISELPPAISHPELLDRRASTLVGTEAVFDMIRQSARALGLASDMVEFYSPDVFIAFDACFTSEDRRIQAAAHRIARQFARNLTSLLIVLRRGDALNRATRPDWDAAYWDYWGSVERIWLGGGLIRGHLRDSLLHDISVLFHRAETEMPHLRLDPYGEFLPLVGAACCAPAGYERALVLDFGSTSIKRGVAEYRGEALIAVNVLKTLAAKRIEIDDESALQHLLWFMQGTLINAYQQAQPDCPVVLVSIASYVDEAGRLMERQGGMYPLLNEIIENLQAHLTEALRAHTGREVSVMLIHDGTAAATAHPGDAGRIGDAVITLGTAIGVGMAAAVVEPMRIAEGFVLK